MCTLLYAALICLCCLQAILIKKSVQRAGPGFGYGFVCAFCFTLAFFCLLCGLVLDGFKDTVQDQLETKLPNTWSQINTGAYLGTIGFAYLCFVMFILFFFALILFQGAVTEELGLPPVRMNPYARMDNQQNPYAMGMQDTNAGGPPGRQTHGMFQALVFATASLLVPWQTLCLAAWQYTILHTSLQRVDLTVLLLLYLTNV